MKRLLLVVGGSEALRPIRLALRNAPEFQVVATLDVRGSARAMLRSVTPDVVLLDGAGPRTSVLARVGEARFELPGATVVLLTGAMDATSIDEAIEAGVDAVVSSGLNPDTLGTLLREIVRGSAVALPQRRANRLSVADQSARTIA